MEKPCSPWQKPLPKPEKIQQGTYTRPEYGSTLSTSLRGGVSMFKSKERQRDKTHQNSRSAQKPEQCMRRRVFA